MSLCLSLADKAHSVGEPMAAVLSVDTAGGTSARLVQLHGVCLLYSLQWSPGWEGALCVLGVCAGVAESQAFGLLARVSGSGEPVCQSVDELIHVQKGFVCGKDYPQLSTFYKVLFIHLLHLLGN